MGWSLSGEGKIIERWPSGQREGTRESDGSLRGNQVNQKSVVVARGEVGV